MKVNKGENWEGTMHKKHWAYATRRQVMMGISTLAAAGLNPMRVLAAEGDALKVAVNDFANEQLDPAAASTLLNEILCCMFEAAIAIDDIGQIAPGIVDRWEPSEDGTAWTLHMRDDVLFHDGTTATSEDLAFAYMHAVAETTDEMETWRSMLGETPRIDILDPQTIVVHTNGPQPMFVPLSTEYGATIWLIPKAYYEQVGPEGFQQHPIGTGPYAFAEHGPGDHLAFKAVDHQHWRVQPSYKEVTIYLVPQEATAYSMLRTGQVDLTAASPAAAESLRAEGYDIWRGAQLQIYATIVGAEHELNKGKPLSDVRVRQALSLAVNRQEMIDSMLSEVGSLPVSIRVASGMPDMTDALREKWSAWAAEAYRYDPEEAKKLLGDAGYPNGFTFELWNIPDSGTPFIGDLVQVLAGYWAAIGVQATITNVDEGQWRAKRNTTASTEAVGVMGVMNSSMDKPSAVENLGVFTSDLASMDQLVGSSWQEEFDQLYGEAVTTLDESVRERHLDRLIELANGSWTAIPIVEVAALFAFSPNVDYVLPRPTINIGYYFAEWKPAAA